MFNKTNKYLAFIMAFILMTASFSLACAESITPYADLVFDSATVNLKSSKRVTYSAITYDTQNTLGIASCWLEEKIDGEWEYVCSLPSPPTRSNTSLYTYEIDYSSYIGSGTFRVGARFYASGHTITRYSSSRSF